MSLYIISIHIENLPSHKNTLVNFAAGVNYIVGKNESGKTSLLEMIEYALYGSSALRGSASDYKELKVKMTFRVLDTIYIVERAKNTSLFRVVVNEDNSLSPELIVRGKTPVQQAIINLLGYSVDVFSKLNFSKQLDGNSLITAKKSERIDLINKINGVDEANSFEKYLETKKKDLKSEIKGIALTANTQSIDFEINENFENIDKAELISNITKDIENLYIQIKRYENLFNSIRTLIKPIKSYTQEQYNHVINNINFNLSSLVTYEETDDLLQNYLNYTKALSDLSSRLSSEKVNLYSGGIQTHIQRQSHLIPEYLNLESLNNLEHILENNKLHSEKLKLLSKGSIDCPQCNSNFPLMFDSLKELNDIEYIEPILDQNTINYYRMYVTENIAETIENVTKRSNEITEQCELISSNLDYSFINQVSSLIKNIKEYEASSHYYNTSISRLFELYGDLITSLDDLPLAEQKLSELSTELSEKSNLKIEINNYFIKKNFYNVAKESKEAMELFVKERQLKIDAYEESIAESKRIKLEIQNTCIPALNYKASEIVNKMTGGEHYSLTLNDTFELQLDTLPIAVFSGSTQVTALVAFRIALIELFYKKSFPVFIGDEIDSFADPERASHIHTALSNLAKDDYQIILVSHHSLAFEGNIIDLNVIKNDT